MAKVEKCLEDDEVAARKQRDKDYQNRRQERLKELGEKKILIRIDNDTYEKLADLCESLGHKRPVPGMHNLIESYSAALAYLLRLEKTQQLCQPQSQASKELYDLYKTVDHFKNDLGLSDSQIINSMKERKIRHPCAVFNGDDRYDWKERHIKKLLNKKLLLSRLSILNEEDK
ncbi:hypothetical protein [Superficieibacter sp. HKU1]|uniref:hypothetical protein n=1 Tax=Superficieibacter sp. HKU1 TaxID=3031919 RepID=UPI0023E136EA|nr:hypothetical protein [Superficieibacter sp. HKU1]WES68574.1 hypothetical protein P0H77_00765 [Superficieibacter sp. HKU1]